MYHMFASGVELGANTLRICTANGPTVCAGCVKDDSIEIIKRSDYGVLKMVENNSVLRVQRKILFFDYVRFLRFLCFLSAQRNRLCALKIFAQRNNFMSVEGRNGRERNRRYCLGRVGLTRRIGLIRHLCRRYY